jgi:hypothetical protein
MKRRKLAPITEKPILAVDWIDVMGGKNATQAILTGTFISLDIIRKEVIVERNSERKVISMGKELVKIYPRKRNGGTDAVD